MRNPAPNDLAARIAMVIQLNAAADSVAPAELARRGSIAWVIHRYCDSDQYAALSAGTVKYYRRFLREIEALGPALPFASFTRRVVVNFIETYTKRHQRRQAAAVLKNLFGIARYYGIVTTDEAAGLRLKTTPPRDRIWTSEEVARWLEAAAREDPHMSTAFLILQFSARRPSDVLKMSGRNIRDRRSGCANRKPGRCSIFPCTRCFASIWTPCPIRRRA